MGIVVLPLDASSGSPSYSAQATRQAFSALMGVSPSTRSLGATSGVRPGTPTNTVNITNNNTWNVGAHSGVLDVETSPFAAPYLYATTGGDSGTITAANATYARVDIVYVQVSDNVQDSSGSETGTVGYLAGTPAASPVAPAAPARSMVLAQINVPAVGGGNPTVSWVAPIWTKVLHQWMATRTTTQSIPSTSETQVVFNSVVRNAVSLYSAASGSATIVVPGWYNVSSSVILDQNSSNNGYVAIEVNGSRVAVTATATLAASANSMRVMTVSTPVYLNAGDVVSVGVWHNNSAALNVTPANGPVSFSGVLVGAG